MAGKEQYPERNAEIRRLRMVDGMPTRAIAAALGVSQSSVWAALNPEKAAARQLEYQKRRYGFDDAYTEKHRACSREYARRKREAKQ
jgi:hypothetical protein